MTKELVRGKKNRVEREGTSSFLCGVLEGHTDKITLSSHMKDKQGAGKPPIEGTTWPKASNLEKVTVSSWELQKGQHSWYLPQNVNKIIWVHEPEKMLIP